VVPQLTFVRWRFFVVAYRPFTGVALESIGGSIIGIDAVVGIPFRCAAASRHVWERGSLVAHEAVLAVAVVVTITLAAQQSLFEQYFRDAVVAHHSQSAGSIAPALVHQRKGVVESF